MARVCFVNDKDSRLVHSEKLITRTSGTDPSLTGIVAWKGRQKAERVLTW